MIMLIGITSFDERANTKLGIARFQVSIQLSSLNILTKRSLLLMNIINCLI